MSSKKHEEKLRAAAETLFRYRGLEKLLNKDSSWEPGAAKLYVSLSWKEEKKEEYVFDPEKGLKIGFDPTKNNVAVLDQHVSEEHCLIFIYGNRICVQDLGSTNGTILQRRFKKYKVTDAIELLDKDKLIIGDITFVVRIRVFQQNY